MVYATTEYSIHLRAALGWNAVVARDDDSDLAGAQGKLVLFLASLMHRSGVVQMAEFGDLLDTFASTVSEPEPEEGRLLSHWAAEVWRLAGR